MPARPDAPAAAAQLSPTEAQFAAALRLLKAATDNMAVAFDALIGSRSPARAESAGREETEVDRMRVGGRAVFGASALRATKAGERLQQEEGGTAPSAVPSTDSDAASSSAS